MNIRVHQGVRPRIAESAYIDAMALVIGDVEIGEDASLWPTTVARGDVNFIRIGARSNIQDATIMHVAHDGPFSPGGFPLIIGDDVTIGHRAIVHACQIGDACLIGMGAIIMDGAVVGKNSIVGAGALVAPGKKVGEGELWLGSPARRVRALSDEEIEHNLYSAAQYVTLKNRHLADRNG